MCIRDRTRRARERGESANADEARRRVERVAASGEPSKRVGRETGDTRRARSIRIRDALESFANRGDARDVRVRANELGRARDVAEWEE